MRKWFVTFLFLTLLNLPDQVFGGFIVTVGNLDLQQGGSGYIDVTISSSDSTPFQLAQAGYSFAITSLGNDHTLEFSAVYDPSNMVYLEDDSSYTSDPKYVFPNSTNGAFSIANLITSSPPGTPGVNNILTGGDANLLDLNDPGLGLANADISTRDLLIRLHVTAALDSLPVVGDQFSVALVPPTGTGDPSGVTLFQYLDHDGNLITEPFTSFSGTVRIVPEPGSFALCAIGGLAGGWILRRRTVRNRACVVRHRTS